MYTAWQFCRPVVGKEQSSSITNKLIAGGWMHKSRSLRKCASMAKSWPCLDPGSLVLFLTIRFKSHRGCSSSNAFQHNNEVQNYFSISRTCQLDLLILWAANWTRRSLSANVNGRSSEFPPWIFLWLLVLFWYNFADFYI